LSTVFSPQSIRGLTYESNFRLIILSVGDDVPVNSDAFLVTDFINLKIKAVQSFRDAHRDSVYVRVFIGVSAHMCMCICVCHIFLKKPRSK
jgi:hypothetical protein